MGTKASGKFSGIKATAGSWERGVHDGNPVKSQNRDADSSYVNPFWLQNVRSIK